MTAAPFHAHLVLAAFQFAAAVVIARSRAANLVARASAAALVAANGGLSLQAALDVGFDVPALGAVLLAADPPTPFFIFLFVLWFPAPRGSDRTRLVLTAGLLAAAAFAAASAWWYAGATPGWVDLSVTIAAVFASYAVAIVVFSRDLVRAPSWPVEWALGAFLLRGADFAARFPGAFSGWAALFPWALAVAVAASVVVVASSRRVTAEARVVIVGLALVGAVMGALGRVHPTDGFPFPQSWVTLTVGRPALLLVALAAPGTVGPFFRGAVIAALAYVLTAGAARAVGLSPPGSPALEAGLAAAVASTVLLAWWYYGRARGRAPAASPPSEARALPSGGTDWERLLAWLAERPRGVPATRAEVAAALDILPRNVHKVVDAANRSAASAPGSPLVTWTLARGRGNQMRYEYELSDAGRRAVGSPAEARHVRKSFDGF